MTIRIRQGTETAFCRQGHVANLFEDLANLATLDTKDVVSNAAAGQHRAHDLQRCLRLQPCVDRFQEEAKQDSVQEASPISQSMGELIDRPVNYSVNYNQ